MALGDPSARAFEVFLKVRLSFFTSSALHLHSKLPAATGTAHIGGCSSNRELRGRFENELYSCTKKKAAAAQQKQKRKAETPSKASGYHPRKAHKGGATSVRVEVQLVDWTSKIKGHQRAGGAFSGDLDPENNWGGI